MTRRFLSFLLAVPLALAALAAYGAADRQLSDTPTQDAQTWATDVRQEIEALWENSFTQVSSIAGTDTITGSASPAIAAYVTGQKFTFTPAADNTGAVTVNWNSVGAKSLLDENGANLVAGVLKSGRREHIEYNGTNFRLISRPFDINGLPALAAPATNDRLAIYDTSATAQKNITLLNFLTILNSLTAETATDATADKAMIYDASASAVRAVLLKYLNAGKQSLIVPASAMFPRNTAGSASLATLETTTNKINIKTLDFDASTQEHAQFTIPRMPAGWNAGTMTARFIWSHPSTTTNFAVVWGLQAVALRDAVALDTAFGTAQEVTDTGGATDTLYHSSATSAMTVGNSPAAGDTIVFQVYRKAADGADTLAVDARLHGVLIEFTRSQGTDD